jgi:hypothetical protein
MEPFSLDARKNAEESAQATATAVRLDSLTRRLM